VAMFDSSSMWKSALAREVVLTRLVRRYAAEGSESGLTACARLLHAAPSTEIKRRLLKSLDQGLSERAPDHRSISAPPELANELAAFWAGQAIDATIIGVMARLDDPSAQHRAAELASDR